MAKQLTAPGCTYSIVARVDTTIYSPDQKWTLDVSAGQTDFIAETNEIIIPGDAMLCRKTKQHSKDRNRINLLGTGSGSLATFVTRAIEQIVGKGNVKVEYGAGKVTVALASSATDAQIAAVESLLERMLPKDVAGELEWEDGLPVDYTPVEYLEGTGPQYIALPVDINTAIAPIEVKTRHLCTQPPSVNRTRTEGTSSDAIRWGTYGFSATSYGLFIRVWNYSARAFVVPSWSWDKWYTYHAVFSATQMSVVDEFGKFYTQELTGTSGNVSTLYLFSAPGRDEVISLSGKKSSFWLKYGDELLFDMIPALTPEGQPCLYDLVSNTAFTNVGSGDFIYPSPESATTYSLRRPVAEYAKITPHGVRRLYKLPDNYTGKPEQYIAENGFKRLVEPEKPEEGYWMPVWHDREDRIELEWVETEPPIEEEFTTQAEQ